MFRGSVPQEVVAAQRRHFATGATRDDEEPAGCDPLDHTNASTGCPSDPGTNVTRLYVMEALWVVMMQAGEVSQIISSHVSSKSSYKLQRNDSVENKWVN